MKYFFDTYALIEIVKANENYKPFASEEIVTSALNLGELYYALLRDFNKKTAINWVERFKKTSMQPGLGEILKAMEFRAANRKERFSFIDCVGYIAAIENNLLFLTGDRGFKGLPGVEFVK